MIVANIYSQQFVILAEFDEKKFESNNKLCFKKTIFASENA